MSLISFQKLCKTFDDGTPALKGIDLEVDEGELLAIVGPSGCGKTTLLRILAGLDNPTSGKITISGKNLDSIEPKNRDLSMVFQNYALFPHLSVFENMAFGLQAQKRPKHEIQSSVEQVAKRLDLLELLARKPAQISGGQRQRVALGRLLVRNPSIRLLDEPLSNLDAHLRSSMRRELALLHQENPCTTLFVTHDQVEAMTLGQRICVMKNGQISQVGTPTEIYDSPDNQFVAQFFGSPPINLFRGEIVDGSHSTFSFRWNDQSISLPPNLSPPLSGNICLGLRPEHLIPIPTDQTKKQQDWSVQLERIENLGDAQIFHLSDHYNCLNLRTNREQNFPPGQITIRPNWEKALWFDHDSGQRL